MTSESSAVARLFGRGSIYTVGRLAQLAAGVAVLPVITRLLGPRQFGTVAASVVVTQLLAVVSGLGLPAVATREFSSPDDGPARARSVALAASLSGIGIAILAHVTGPLWSNVFGGMEYDAPLVLAVLASIPLTAVNAGQALLRAEDRAAAFVTSALLASIGAQLGGLAALALTTRDPAHYLAGVLLGYVASAGVTLSGSRLGGRSPLSISVLSLALRFGLPTVPHSLAMYLLNAADRVVIERTKGLGQVGRYQIAYAIGSLGILLLNAANNAWGPLVYSAEDDARWPVLAETAQAMQRVVIYVTGGIALAGPVAATVVAPEAYRPSDLAPVIAVVALSTLPYSLFMTYVLVLFSTRRTGSLAYAAPIAAGANIGLCLVLVPPFGLVGAAAATFLAFTALAAVAVYSGRRFARRLGLKAYVRSSWLFGGSLGMLGAVLPTSPIWSTFRVLAGVAIGLLLLRVLRSLARAGSSAIGPPEWLDQS